MEKRLPYNPESADYQAGLMAGAHRMADYLIKALEEQYPGNLELYEFMETKKWEAIENQFENEYDAVFDNF